jgi:hypothetical protein
MIINAWGRMANPAALAKIVIGSVVVFGPVIANQMKGGNEKCEYSVRDFKIYTDFLCR